jgi:hypothetical protein
MKFKVTMKDPDTLSDAIEEAVEDDLVKVEGLTDEDREALFDTRRERASELAAKWFKYGEYLTVEIDTEAKTATVCEAD